MTKRDTSIDLVKGILAVLMILAHVIQFFCQQNKFTGLLSNYINLTSFSGFVFVFGYVNHLAYFTKEDSKQARKKPLNSAFSLLSIYYLSAVFFRLLVTQNLITNGLNGILKIITLSDIAGYSEILLAFFIINILSFLFINIIKKLQLNLIFLLIGICLLLTILQPNWIAYKQLALIWGYSNFNLFPVVSYLPYFLIGVLFAKYGLEYKFKHLLLAALFTLAFAAYIFINKKIPSRFPPNIFWIFGPAFFIYLYYIGSKFIYHKSWNQYLLPIEKIGNHTLFYLILSNIFIFAISTQLGKVFQLTGCILISIFILFAINRLQEISK